MTAAGPAGPGGLAVLAKKQWPVDGDAEEPPALAGFVLSSFSPMVAAVADRCLRAYHGTPPVDPALGERTAVVLVSRHGDVTTAKAVARAVDAGGRVAPLLFFQSVPNAVVGHVAARWALSGPVVCTSPVGDPLGDGRTLAELLIEDDAADAVLLIVAEQAPTKGERDSATALLLGTNGSTQGDDK